MQVGYSRKLLGDESAIQCIQARYAFVFALDVCLHEAYVRGEVFEE